MPATTSSRSASSKTTTGALPPSSRCTRLSVSDAALATAFPVATSPVRETISTPGWRTMPAPAGSPSPVTTFRTPRGKMSAASSAILRVVSGVCSEGFSTTVLPAARAGPIFQTAIMKGVIPGRYLADDADGLAADHAGVPAHVLAGRLALDVARHPGEETQVVDDVRQLLPRRRNRLPHIARLQLGQLLRVLFQNVGEPVQHPRPLSRRG